MYPWPNQSTSYPPMLSWSFEITQPNGENDEVNMCNLPAMRNSFISPELECQPNERMDKDEYFNSHHHVPHTEEQILQDQMNNVHPIQHAYPLVNSNVFGKEVISQPVKMKSDRVCLTEEIKKTQRIESEWINPLQKKVFNRKTTCLLRAWLRTHQHNPYPTKGEKIVLAIITHMSLTQISTWFANARRRLKKETQLRLATQLYQTKNCSVKSQFDQN